MFFSGLYATARLFTMKDKVQVARVSVKHNVRDREFYLEETIEEVTMEKLRRVRTKHSKTERNGLFITVCHDPTPFKGNASWTL